MKALTSVVFASAILLFAAGNLLACKCASSNVDESFAAADGVFLGTVESIEKSGDRIFGLIKVEKSIKGVDRERVRVETDNSDCGLVLRVGDKVYLFVKGSGDTYRDMPCHRHGGDDIFKTRPAIELQNISPISSAVPETSQRKPGEIGSETRVWRYVVFGSAVLFFGLIVILAAFRILSKRKP